MPTYQYACTACGAKHEAVQSFTDAHLTDCPTCGGLLRKVFSAVGVVFKGSGFYKNDSRSGDKKDGSPSSSPAPSAPAAGSSEGSAAASTSTSTSPAATPSVPSAPASTPSSTSTPAAKTA